MLWQGFHIYESYTNDLAEVESWFVDQPDVIRTRKALDIRVRQIFDDSGEIKSLEVLIAYVDMSHVGTYVLDPKSKVVLDYESSEVLFSFQNQKFVVRVPKGRILAQMIGAIEIRPPRSR